MKIIHLSMSKFVYLSFLSIYRDFSTATSGSDGVIPETMALVYNPQGELSFNLSASFPAPSSLFEDGPSNLDTCYKSIFHNIQPPRYKFSDLDTQHANGQDMIDCRFYISVAACSGYTFKIECIAGGKLCDINKEVPFPSLSQIVRLQLTRKLETDILSKTYEIVFKKSRYEFLQDIFYPEISSQLDYFLTKNKLASQLNIAKKVLAARSSQNSEAWLLSTSFHSLSDEQLKAWIADATCFVSSRRFVQSRTKPAISLATREVFAVPANRNQFRYTFVRQHDNASLITSALIFKCRRWRRNGSFMASYAKLSRICPYRVLTPSAPNAKHVDNTQCIRDFMHFLSYGFYDLNKFQTD